MKWHNTLLSQISLSLLFFLLCDALLLLHFSHRPDTTQVDHAIPLRDNWALPYFSCQVAALTGFLSNNISSATEVSLWWYWYCWNKFIIKSTLHFTQIVFSIDVLLSCHECHHLYLPTSLGTQPLCSLHPRPLSFPAGLFWPGAVT